MAKAVAAVSSSPGAPSAVIEEIAAKLARLTPGRSVTMTLSSGELGKVVIRFARRGSQWKVHLITERSDAAALLVRDLPRLEGSLERTLQGTRIDVSVGPEADAGKRSSGRDGDEGSERGHSPVALEAKGGLESSSASLSASASGPIVERDRLDILT